MRLEAKAAESRGAREGASGMAGGVSRFDACGAGDGGDSGERLCHVAGKQYCSPTGRSSRARVAPTVAALILLIAGAVLLFGPLVRSAISQASMNTEIAKVAELRSSGDGSVAEGDDSAAGVDGGSGSGSGSDGASAGASALIASDLTQARALLESYNAKVSSGEVAIASDPFAFGDAVGLFGLQGLGDGLVGSIDIPAMNCELPLYLGASEDHMAKGATVVAGSSAPLGQTSSNCVIAGHRGYGAAAMFRDIEKLSVGDKIFVHTLWDDLVYTVAGTKVIDPTDTAAVGVQTGRDMVTLVTCHPYGYNTHRYVVECVRSDDASAGESRSGCSGDSAAADHGSGSSQGQGSGSQDNGVTSGGSGLSLPEVEDWLRALGGAILLTCAIVLVVRAVKSARRRTSTPKTPKSK